MTEPDANYQKPNYQQPGYQPAQYGKPYGAPPFYGPGADPAAPFGRHPATGEPLSDKAKSIAGLLQIVPVFVGLPMGIGRFYMGSTTIGIVMAVSTVIGYLLIFTFIGALIGIPLLFAVGVWSVIDGIVLMAGSPRDGQGRPLRP